MAARKAKIPHPHPAHRYELFMTDPCIPEADETPAHLDHDEAEEELGFDPEIFDEK